MTKIEVALDAYVIGADHKIYKCSPGKTHRFYKEIRKANAVFLDLRGLDALPANPDDWDDKQLLQIIADDRWDREVVSRARGNKPVGSKGVGRTDKTRLGFLKGLLFEAKKGDLIVVPSDGYDKDVLIGELLDDAGDIREIVASDDGNDFTYLGRRVKWRAAQPKRFLSGSLIKAIHTQTAFFQLGVSLHHEVYRLAFSNFVFRGEYVAEFRTTKEKFTAEDHAVVSTWLNGLDVIRNQIGADGAASKARPPSFYELGLTKLDDQLAAEIQIDIQSPGEIFVKTFGPFALALMVMFSLPGCDTSQVQHGVTVKLKTVGAQGSEASEVENCVKNIAIALGHTRLDEACDLADRAIKDAKMKTNATLKSSGKKSN